MKKILSLLFIISTSLIAFSQNPNPPIMLDEIHYYVNDGSKLGVFLKDNFAAKPMAEVSDNPLRFIDFWEIGKGQATINVSPKGPFAGIRVGDPKRWEKETITPSADLPIRYGVYWTSFSTKNLKKSLAELKKNNVLIKEENVKLPYFKGKAAVIWTNEFNRILLVEGKKVQPSPNDSPYKIDHILILVSDLQKNLQFFQDLYAAKVISQKEKFAEIIIGSQKVFLSEPEAINLKREEVLPIDPKKFYPSIDHIGCLYENTKPAFEYAQSKGIKFLLVPTNMKYFDKPTPYTFAIAFSPDGLQCEMVQEPGRVGPRTKYLKMD